MSRVTEEQIARAKQWDLLSYLQTYEPGELVQKHGEYRTKTHGSLVISKGLWCWNSQGIGGKTALDYFIKVRGMGFTEAVEAIVGGNSAPYHPSLPEKNEKPKKTFALPEAARCATHTVSYLQGRGIHPDIISHCIGAGVLYESSRHHNCVFVGKDPTGTARFATLRGTFGDFKMDVESSDKRYNFCMPAADIHNPYLAVTESPVDALSLATILHLQGKDWTHCSYLALGGTAPRALLQYLHDHPQVTHISLCLDNDKAGLSAMRRITDAVLSAPELAERIALIHPNPPPVEHGKDYNEFLQAKVSAQRQEKNALMER